jgi:hypothetical protein
MGAFGNYPIPHKYEVDFTQNQPVAVNVTFNTIGKYKPESFVYITPDQERHIYKIQTIRWQRPYDHYDAFCCVYTNYGKQYEILLKFHIKQCVWTISIL